MKELDYNLDDRIAALATPWGESALAVIRTSGEGTIDSVCKIFSRPDALKKAQGFTMLYGFVQELSGESIDEVTLAVYHKGKSYTGEESVEFFVHGSLPGISRIMDALKSVGFRQAGPGEFTMRAFLNGKMDLTRAEAVQEIVSAKSSRAQSLALSRLNGTVEGKIQEIKDTLLNFMAALSLELDYAEDEVEQVEIPMDKLEEGLGGIQRLLSTYKAGRIYQEGVRVVLAGRTNSGKSSLFNLFLKEDRSIVSDIHGTTRDYLESWISLAGIPIRLYDTAGLRITDNPIEEEGIKRSGNLIQESALILYLIDGTQGLTQEDRDFLEEYKEDPRLVPLWNKIDQTDGDVPEGFFPLSAETGEGFSRLEEEVENRLIDKSIRLTGEPVIDSNRQKDLLSRAAESLSMVKGGLEGGTPVDMVALDLKDAMDALGEITGEVTSSDILNRMFSNFCVGK